MLIIGRSNLGTIAGLNTETLQSFYLPKDGPLKAWEVAVIIEQSAPGAIDKATCERKGWERLW